MKDSKRTKVGIDRGRKREGELIQQRKKKSEEGLKRLQSETQGESEGKRIRAGGKLKVAEGGVRCKERVTELK